MEDLKVNVKKCEPEIADVMVPNCIYRCGCPEFAECGFFKKFCESVENKEELLDIHKRYELYNQMFYDRFKN